MPFWIFKCDPKRYDLAKRLAHADNAITWLVSRYKKEIQPGDIVFLMETGPNRSIRAVMRVDSAPADMPELEFEQQFWKERDTATKCRVRGTILHRTELPIKDLEGVKGLENLSILHGVQQGTNFRVSEEEGEVLMGMVQALPI